MISMLETIRGHFLNNGWFTQPGAYILIDGQFGSTGKGALAALIGELLGDKISYCTTNAGPNSGHTGFVVRDSAQHDDPLFEYNPMLDRWSKKVLTQQIPVVSVVAKIPAVLNAGAVVSPPILRAEAARYGFDKANLFVHPNAAVIDPEYEHDDAESTAKIASTNKGVGRAIARKVMREGNVAKGRLQDLAYFSTVGIQPYDWSNDVVFVETAQGFSLGIDQPFYPYTTSRNCTVGQALSDAGIHPSFLRKTIMCVRTFPIRVGNTPEGHSGDCYPDQQETTWEELGLAPELTTVTKRVRRVFTWSRQQFRDAVATNRPDAIFVNFFQYLKDGQDDFMRKAAEDYVAVMGRKPDFWLIGFGPYPEDVRVVGGEK